MVVRLTHVRPESSRNFLTLGKDQVSSGLKPYFSRALGLVVRALRVFLEVESASLRLSSEELERFLVLILNFFFNCLGVSGRTFVKKSKNPAGLADRFGIV